MLLPLLQLLLLLLLLLLLRLLLLLLLLPLLLLALLLLLTMSGPKLCELDGGNSWGSSCLPSSRAKLGRTSL